MATLLPKKSSVASKVPLTGDLEIGEIAINLEDKKIYSKQTNGTVVEMAGGGGGVTTTELLAATFTDTTGGQAVSTAAFTKLNNWSTQITNANYTNNTSTVTVVAAGTYQIDTIVCVTGTTSNYRWTGEIEFQKNASTRIASTRGGYIRTTGGSNHTTINLTKVVELAAGDSVCVRLARINTTVGDATTFAGGSHFSLVKLDGVQGADGAAGAAGAGIPSGGTVGQLIESDGAGSTNWIDPPTTLSTLPFDIAFSIQDGENTDFTLNQSAGFEFTILGAVFTTSNGSINAQVNIETTNVTGLASLSVSSSESSATATAQNVVSVGEKLVLRLTSNASAADVSVTLNCQRSL